MFPLLRETADGESPPTPMVGMTEEEATEQKAIGGVTTITTMTAAAEQAEAASTWAEAPSTAPAAEAAAAEAAAADHRRYHSWIRIESLAAQSS